MEVAFEVKISRYSLGLRAKSQYKYTRFWKITASPSCAGSQLAVAFDVELEPIGPRLVE